MRSCIRLENKLRFKTKRKKNKKEKREKEKKKRKTVEFFLLLYSFILDRLVFSLNRSPMFNHPIIYPRHVDIMSAETTEPRTHGESVRIAKLT